MNDYLHTQFTSTSRTRGAFQPGPTTSQLKAQALTLINQCVPHHLRLEARATLRRMQSSDQVERFIARFQPPPRKSDHTYNIEYNLPHTD